jgi:hypothetical protein
VSADPSTPAGDGPGAVTARRAVGAGAVAVVLLLATGALAVGAGPFGGDDAATGFERVAGVGPQGAIPQFTVSCGWSHRAPDDPIVHAGHHGRSHLHDFFGATDVDAASTAASLLGSPTTRDNRRDTAAYWAPALLDGGSPVEPLGSDLYYGVGGGVDPSTVEPFPHGLLVVAGDPTADRPQPLDHAAWRCGASPVLHAEPPDCPEGAPLTVRVSFPDCWDGRNLDSDDHRSHLARSARGACPAGHPVAVPHLVMTIAYPVWGDDHDLELSSGGVHGMHADFVNAWDQEALAREVRVCLNRSKVCGVVSNRATG